MKFKLTTSCSCRGNYANGFRIEHFGDLKVIDIRYPNDEKELSKAKRSIKALNFYDVHGYTQDQLINEAMKRNTSLTRDEAMYFVIDRVNSETIKIQERLKKSGILEELEVLK